MKEKLLNIWLFWTVRYKCVFMDHNNEPGVFVINPYVAAFASFLSAFLPYETIWLPKP